jgi:hypothetical protein
MDEPNVRAVLRLLEQTQLEFALEVDEASYFLSTIAAEYFGLPRERTVIMGSRIEVRSSRRRRTPTEPWAQNPGTSSLRPARF